MLINFVGYMNEAGELAEDARIAKKMKPHHPALSLNRQGFYVRLKNYVRK